MPTYYVQTNQQTGTVWRAWTTASSTESTAGLDAASISHDTWPMWVSHQTTTAATSSNTTWACWNGTTTTAATMTITADQTWDAWTSGTYIVVCDRAIAPAPLTPEQQAARERQLEDGRRRAEEQNRIAAEYRAKEEKRLAAAKAKAELLLLQHLTPEQEKAWNQERAFFVTSKSGRRFQIKEGYGGNLTEIGPDGKPIRGFCVHIPSTMPIADNMLTQKLALECNEEALLRVANSWELNQLGQRRSR